MVNRNVISRRIEQIDRHLERLSPYAGTELGHFLEDSNAQDIVEYNLFQCVNHLIDMMQHIPLPPSPFPPSLGASLEYQV